VENFQKHIKKRSVHIPNRHIRAPIRSFPTQNSGFNGLIFVFTHRNFEKTQPFLIQTRPGSDFTPLFFEHHPLKNRKNVENFEQTLANNPVHLHFRRISRI
jgi:hypothetical protein